MLLKINISLYLSRYLPDYLLNLINLIYIKTLFIAKLATSASQKTYITIKNTVFIKNVRLAYFVIQKIKRIFLKKIDHQYLSLNVILIKNKKFTYCITTF